MEKLHYQGQEYVIVTPCKSLMKSKLLQDVVNRGDLLAITPKGTLTVLPKIAKQEPNSSNSLKFFLKDIEVQISDGPIFRCNTLSELANICWRAQKSYYTVRAVSQDFEVANIKGNLNQIYGYLFNFIKE